MESQFTGTFTSTQDDMSSSACVVCYSERLSELIDFGVQPLSNRFPASSAEEEFLFRLRLGWCPMCETAQLINPPSPDLLRARYDWIKYREPEDHVDDLINAVTELPGITRETLVMGVSDIDSSVLAGLRRLGFEKTRLLQPSDLDALGPNAGLETIQNWITQAGASIIGQQERPKVLVARRILEHSHQTAQFLLSLKHIVDPGGYVVIEVPDCGRMFEQRNYSFVWEEHIIYFTEGTLCKALELCSLPVIYSRTYEYPYENSLVVFAQPNTVAKQVSTAGQGNEMLTEFGRDFAQTSLKWRSTLSDIRASGEAIALFGAGHIGAAFINLLGLGHLIDFVVDDHPRKRGMFMPGSKIPIVDSSILLEGNVGLCLLSLNPESERKVRERYSAFVASGGDFLSIFSSIPQLSRLKV